jgi:branched-chain amino acid transport system permease protein
MMDAFIQQLLSGLSNGSIYAALGLALVMIYQSTHRINFAQGEMATFSTFIAWFLLNQGWPYWGAFTLTVVVSFAGGMLIHRILRTPLTEGPALTQVGIGIGLLMFFNAISGWLFDHTLKIFPSPFQTFWGAPSSAGSPRLMQTHTIGTLGVMTVVLAAMFGMLRWSRWGLALRAVAHNRAAAQLLGLPVATLLGLGWGLAAAVGAIAGMMVAPIVFLEPSMMSSVLVYALAGALLGGLDNPWGAVVGGLIVGVLETLLGVYLIGNQLKLSAALVLIVGILAVRPQGLFGRAIIQRV